MAHLADGVQQLQHDGVAGKILADLACLANIVDFIAWMEPKQDMRPVLKEWCAEVYLWQLCVSVAALCICGSFVGGQHEQACGEWSAGSV